MSVRLKFSGPTAGVMKENCVSLYSLQLISDSEIKKKIVFPRCPTDPVLDIVKLFTEVRLIFNGNTATCCLETAELLSSIDMINSTNQFGRTLHSTII